MFQIYMTNFFYFLPISYNTLGEAKAIAKKTGFEHMIYKDGVPYFEKGTLDDLKPVKIVR